MALKLGRKAVFFTFTACVFLSLLIFSSNVGNNYEMRQKSFVLETRIDSMNNFISDVENDVEKAIYIAGFRSLIGLEEHIVSTGEYLSDLDANFSELFFNGTINGVNSSFMVNNTFTDWMDRIEDEADKIDIIINFSIQNTSLSQDNPWEVRIDMDLIIDVVDKKDVCRWNKNKSITAHIEIAGFEDPIYRLGTNGMFENRIEKTNFSYFVSGTNIDNLLNHTYSGYYTEFSGAPSYLMRLQGDFGESEYGIESLVDIDELVSMGISIKQKTIVDYLYFGTENPPRQSVSGAPSWFRLDNRSNMDNSQGHYDLYEVIGLV